MSIEPEFTEMPGYLLAVASGQWTTKAATKFLDEVKHEAESRGMTRLLIDVLPLRMPSSEFTRYETGVYLAEILYPPFKIAVIANPEDINRFSENVASNRGATIKNFTGRQEAVDWLMKETG